MKIRGALTVSLLALAMISLVWPTQATSEEYEFGISEAMEPCNDKWCDVGPEPFYELSCKQSQWTWCKVQTFQCGPAICTECFSFDCAF